MDSILHREWMEMISGRKAVSQGSWRLPSALGVAMVLALSAGACADNDDGTAVARDESPRQGFGEECVVNSDCRSGLSCTERTCQPDGNSPEGGRCAIDFECGPDLFCNDQTAMCQSAGEGVAGEPCSGAADCGQGMRCRAQGFNGVCAEGGELDVDKPCLNSDECLAGLNCAPDPADLSVRRCTAGPAGLPRPFAGVECRTRGSETDEPLRAYFELPTDETKEFYALPFPNDIRLKNGRPDLSQHPTPGSEVLGFDIVKRYIDAIEGDQDHFGINQAVLLRFSGRIDFSDTSLNSGGDSPSLYLVDITPTSEEYNDNQPIFWQASTAPSAYICGNWVSVRPTWGRPLNPRTTYAVIVTTDVKGENGESLVQDDDFAAMLSGSGSGAAWDAYQPLRDWITDQGIDGSTLAVASVFTTGDPREITKGLRDAARTTRPAAKELTTCADGVQSPCEDGLDGDAHQRGCMGTNAAFTEIQGKLSLPIFQRGSVPYLEEGGGLEFLQGAPAIQRQEDVCIAMTVPNEMEMPEEGWPVLIYAHGTGGSYRSHVGSVAPLVSQIQVGADTVGMLTIGWDQVQHFTRRGDSDLDPEPLVYNFANPEVARGNFWQAAAEVHSLVQFIETLDLEVDGKAIKADFSKIYFMGHSQGGTSGPIALPYEPGVKGAILSGAGAGLTLSLLGKTSPVNIPDAVALALQDAMLSESHPILNLLQGYFDPVDPLSYAQYIGARRIEGETTPRHVFHAFGVGDTFTPNLTLETMATALRLTMIEPMETELERGFVNTSPVPVEGNVSVGGDPYTVVGRQYTPADYDGHFVIFRDDAAKDDLVEFLGSALTNGVPSIKD